MFVIQGARDVLLEAERGRFINEQWPAIEATIARLGLKPKKLLAAYVASAKTRKER